jgi:transposase-like protein
LTPNKHEFEHDVKLDVEARVRQGVKAVLEEVLQEEMTQHLEAGFRELTPTRRGERKRPLPTQSRDACGQDRASGGAQGP